jgi:hypothetical protein
MSWPMARIHGQESFLLTTPSVELAVTATGAMLGPVSFFSAGRCPDLAACRRAVSGGARGLARGETTAGCCYRLGVELPLLFAVGAFALALTGPGRFSLDALLGLEPLMTPRVVYAVLAIGILGGVANLAVRRATPGQPSTR